MDLVLVQTTFQLTPWLALPILRLQVKLGQCRTKLHDGNVLGMLFFYKQAIFMELDRKLGENQSPKTIS